MLTHVNPRKLLFKTSGNLQVKTCKGAKGDQNLLRGLAWLAVEPSLPWSQAAPLPQQRVWDLLLVNVGAVGPLNRSSPASLI